MRVVLQRVLEANVSVEGEIVGKVGHGLLIFLGVGAEDTKAECERLSEKIVNLRIFSDENDKINLSLKDVNGGALVVSQFTLYADCRKGNRPNFTMAAKPDHANELYEYFINLLKEKNIPTEAGIFGADMNISLVNNGPFTIVLE